jgi:2-pyrone-4,6-dicarboxylate lactonase
VTALVPGGPGWASNAASGGFEMDSDWLPYHASPSKPSFALPAGAVDAHCHVFGPGAEFPYASGRRYTPCDASHSHLRALRDFLGFERNVLVQATCHGADNRALEAALHALGGQARGVATVGPAVTDEELARLHNSGVRGVRFNFLKRLGDAAPPHEMLAIARRIAALGWHVDVYLEAADLPGLLDFLASLPSVVVIDHMGRPDVLQPPAGSSFGQLVDLMRERPHVWSKVSCPERLSKSGPPGYDDVVPFARRLIESFPDRVLWGTDWPHPNLKSHMPDDGRLVDFIPRIARTADLQRRLLVANPLRLFWAN